MENIDIKLTEKDIEVCHCLGKSGNYTIVRFVNWKICSKALEKKKDLNGKLSHAKIGFQTNMKIFFGKNLTS